MRCRGERGQTTIEYVGALVVVVALVAGLLLAGLAPPIVDRISEAICELTGGGDCSAGGSAGSDAPDAQTLEARAAAIQPFTESHGGLLPGLLDDVRTALASGDLAGGQARLDRLELYRNLSGGGRGELMDDLLGGDAAFQALVNQGTIDLGDTNRLYFNVPPSPGDGVIAIDFFIPYEGSVMLRGDNRDVVDPILGDLEIDQSRVTVVIDRESGRAMITQTETCTRGVVEGMVFCQAPRPITLAPPRYDPQLWPHDPNEFGMRFGDDSMTLDYDALNSITPGALSVDGHVVFTRGDDGYYRVTEDDRGQYPSIATYQYRPGQDARLIDRLDSEPVVRGATPFGVGDVACDVGGFVAPGIGWLSEQFGAC